MTKRKPPKVCVIFLRRFHSEVPVQRPKDGIVKSNVNGIFMEYYTTITGRFMDLLMD